MQRRCLKLLVLIITLISPLTTFAQSQDYPEVLDNFIFPLGYDKNVFDTSFVDFEDYVKKNYQGWDLPYGGSFPGVKNVRINKEILGVKFNLAYVIYFDHAGPFIQYSTYEYHSNSEHGKLLNNLKAIGAKLIESKVHSYQDGSSSTVSEFNYKDKLEISVNYGDEVLELTCKKKSPDLATGFPKVKPASTASASSTKSDSKTESTSSLVNANDFYEYTKEFFTTPKSYYVKELIIPELFISSNFEDGVYEYKSGESTLSIKGKSLYENDKLKATFDPQIKEVTVFGESDVTMQMIIYNDSQTSNNKGLRATKWKDGKIIIYEYVKNRATGKYIMVSYYELYKD